MTADDPRPDQRDDPGSRWASDPDRHPAAWAARVPADQREAVLRTFVGPTGRLRRLPAKLSKRLIVLDHVAQRLEPGVRYSEREVNEILREVDDDVATLRRYLVDEGFCDRRYGWYWRTGGSVHL